MAPEEEELMEVPATPIRREATSSQATAVDPFEEKLRELVESNEIDFDCWTLLITETEQATPIEIRRICMVYDYFLSEYPLCFGYWRKYANLKAKLCTLSEAQDVFERAVQSATYCVDLWVSYCSFGVLSYQDPNDVRRLFERGLSFVGKDYFCHYLWDKYIEFEFSLKQWARLAHVYINTLRFPTKKLHSYYKSFKQLCTMWTDEIEKQSNVDMQLENASSGESEDIQNFVTVGTSEIIRELLDDTCGLSRSIALKRYLSAGDVFYRKSSEIDIIIRSFEAHIRRPYFHVKPLDDHQLENWHRYLDFVEKQGDFDWTVKLYERCLIACANYPEFWVRYVKYVDKKGGREIANHALTRASTIFLKKHPEIHLYAALFKESLGDIPGSRASFHKYIVDLNQVIDNLNREANLERRLGNNEAACMVYEKAIEAAKKERNFNTLSVLCSNYAQFTFVVTGKIDTSLDIFTTIISEVPCKLLIEGLLDFVTIHGGAGQISKLYPIVATVIAPTSDESSAWSSEEREDISRSFIKFVELHGTIHDIRKAWEHHFELFRHKARPPTTSFHASSRDIVEVMSELREAEMSASTCHACSHRDEDSVNISPVKGCHDLTEIPDESKCMEVERHDGVEVRVANEVESKVHNIRPVDEIQEVHESCSIIENPESLVEDPTTLSVVQQGPIVVVSDDLAASVLEKLSIDSPVCDAQDVKTVPSNGDDLNESMSSPNRISSVKNDTDREDVHELIPIKTSVGPQDNYSPSVSYQTSEPNGEPVHANSESNEADVSHATRSSLPPPVSIQEDPNHVHLVMDRSPLAAQNSDEHQMLPQLQSNSYQASESHVGNAGSHGEQSHTHHGRQSLGNDNEKSPECLTPEAGQIYAQMWGPQAQLMWHWAASQGYQYQYPSSTSAQQDLYLLQQTNPQPSSSQPSQSHVFQYSQSNSPYGYLQSGQGYPPHVWQHYQQQLYYLQQQQTMMMLQLQQQPEHAQKLPQKPPLEQEETQPRERLDSEKQQQFYQLQQYMYMQQQQQQQQQQLFQQQQRHGQQQQQQLENAQNLPQKLQSEQKDTQPRERSDSVDQQQQLYHLQQHMYMQQQQQQQHYLLLQQQQQQKQPQQQELEFLQQQQQLYHQMLQNQTAYQQQHQLQASTLDPQTLNLLYLQQTLRLQHQASNLHTQGHSNQATATEGQPQHGERSASPIPSTQQD